MQKIKKLSEFWRKTTRNEYERHQKVFLVKSPHKNRPEEISEYTCTWVTKFFVIIIDMRSYHRSIWKRCTWESNVIGLVISVSRPYSRRPKKLNNKHFEGYFVASVTFYFLEFRGWKGNRFEQTVRKPRSVWNLRHAKVAENAQNNATFLLLTEQILRCNRFFNFNSFRSSINVTVGYVILKHSC